MNDNPTAMQTALDLFLMAWAIFDVLLLAFAIFMMAMSA